MARGSTNNIQEEEKTKLSRENILEAMKIFQYIAPYKWYLIVGMFLLFISSVVFLSFFTLFKWMVNSADGAEVPYDFSLSQFGVIIIGILIIQGFVSYFRVTLFAHASENGTADIRKALYQKIVSLPITFFEQNKSGELISRLTADVERLYNTFSIVLAEITRQVVILIGSIVLLFFTSPKLTLIMLSSFPVVVVAAFFFGRYIRKLSKQRQKAIADSNIILSESVQTIQVIKAFTNELFQVNKYRNSNDDIVAVAMKFARGRAIFSVFIVTILFGAICYIIWQAALMLQNGDLLSGDILAFVGYTLTIGAAIGGLGNFYTELVGAVGATERIREILNMDNEVEISDLEGMEVGRFSGEVEFKNVQFSYPSRKDVEVLKGLNLKIKAGQRVALVGTSGAGKSTVMQLLLRFYDIDGGEILVDGKSIFDYNISSYRSNLSIVPQEVILFGGTIRENILYGRENATEEEVIEAAKQSNSWEFIQSFPDGLETIIGERGVKLSGGQRQRIAIARALLKDPSILLLDEATSALDTESERVVQDALDKLMVGRTSIIIAHRLSTIKDVDCIYVLDEGQIEEQGKHQELMVADGLYSYQAKLGGME